MTETSAAENAPTTSAPELAAVPAEAVPSGPVTQPVEVLIEASPGATEAPAPAVAEVAAESKPVRRKAAGNQVSDETLAEWQAKLAAARAAKAQARKPVQAKIAKAVKNQANAEVFRALRQLVQQGPTADVESDPELQALAADALARQVHQAPAHVRQVISATLGLLGGKRRGRPARR